MTKGRKAARLAKQDTDYLQSKGLKAQTSKDERRSAFLHKTTTNTKVNLNRQEKVIETIV